MFFLYFFCYVSRLGSSKVILSVNQNSWNFTFSYFICPTRRLQLVKRVRANADALLQVAVLLLLFFSDFNQYSHEKNTLEIVIEIIEWSCICCAWPCGPCTAVRGCVLLCVAVPGYAWLCMAMRGCEWLCVAVCGCAWPCVNMH